MHQGELIDTCGEIWNHVNPCDYQIAIGHNGEKVIIRVENRRAMAYIDEIMNDHFPDTDYDVQVVGKIRPL